LLYVYDDVGILSALHNYLTVGVSYMQINIDIYTLNGHNSVQYTRKNFPRIF